MRFSLLLLLSLLLGVVLLLSHSTTVLSQDDAEADASGGEEEAEAEAEAEEEEDAGPVHPLMDALTLDHNEEVLIGASFPLHQDKKIPIGKVVDVTVGVINMLPEPINVTMIMGSINSPFDSAFYVQNFTKYQANLIVQEEEEYSLHYKFFPSDQVLDPVDYQMALTVFYETEDEEYAYTFFNSTVEFFEEGNAMEVKEILTFVFFVVLAGFVGFAIFGKTETAVKNNTDMSTVNKDWVTMKKASEKQKKVKRGSKKKGKKKTN